MKKNNIISDWLDQHGDPEIDRFVEKNLAITEKVRNAMILKGWNKSDLAKALDKSPSEVTKWLSGMHNLTLKSIVKMERVLGVELSSCTPISEVEYYELTLENSSNTESFEDLEYTENQDGIYSYQLELVY